ncbi:MAG: response regulator transcription factor [Alistipes sp.]|jgi:two-component system alkaline phosphatase synthesis response regulator PhoP|nr:response regulator transcription factor [Alistipes sp.]
MKYRILLVDDEDDILEFVGYNLQKEGYEVATASNGVEALERAIEFRPHLILLDRLMPQMDGLETCRRIRQRGELSGVRVVFLSALGEDDELVRGFDAGADGYISKPVGMKVLMSRVAAILKHVELGRKEALVVDRERCVVVLNGEEILLPRKEFKLLELLSSNPGKLFSREEIYNRVWGNEVVVGDRTIDVHVRKLRSKIGDGYITTVKGFGYKFEG